MSDYEKNNSMTALIAGVIIGAGVTYLFTTTEGKKLKEKLIDEGSKLLDKVKEGLEEAGEEIEEKGKLATKIVSQEAESAKENVGEVISQVPQHIEQVQKKGRRFFFKKHSSGES